MTRDEVKAMMKYFQASYMGFCEGMDFSAVLNVWSDAFKDEDAVVVQTAARNFVSSSEFQPTIAGLKKQIQLIKAKDTETDLWAKIAKAASKGAYYSVEEFEKLPPECQSFVGSPTALKELSQIDQGTMNTIVKGQFLKRVQAIKEHQEVQRGLPAEVRQAIEESKMRMLMEGDYL